MNPSALDEALRLALNERPALRSSEESLKARLIAVQEQLGSLPGFVADLCLATACIHAETAAIQDFDAELLSQVPRFIAHLGLGEDDVKDVQQGLRIRLLMPPAPKLASYLGSAPLSGWLRVVAVRAALHMMKSGLTQRARPPGPSAVEAFVAAGHEAELTPLLERHREDIKRVIQDVLGGLPPQEKTLLRLHVLDGLNLNAIAGIYGLHRATITRRMAALRKQAFQKLKKKLGVDLRVSTTEMQSLLNYFGRDLELSLTRVLEDGRR